MVVLQEEFNNYSSLGSCPVKKMRAHTQLFGF